ncbi:MAG: hypothetical protein HYV97_07575 [Bdellovibrio sp.]|nr:hypothetical protein [Bdellovibrio sp.]
MSVISEKDENQEFLAYLPEFENFLEQIGLKRIEGSVYGLLVLSNTPLTSEQIEERLGLSQSAVSNALRSLTHFGAVETITSRDTRQKLGTTNNFVSAEAQRISGQEARRQRLHQAKEDSLSIAATVFRKREQKEVVDFRKMAERLLALAKERGDDEMRPRVLRLRSIILTCQIAEAVMNFVIEVVDLDLKDFYAELVHRFPKALNLLTQGLAQAKKMSNSIPKNSIAHKLIDGIGRVAGHTLRNSQMETRK